jgi:hypothetical protein
MTMTNAQEVKIEVTAEKAAIEALAGDIRTSGGDEAQVVQTRPERDEAKQAFGVGELATAIIVIKLAYYTGKLAELIYERIRRSRSKVFIRTPYGSVEITYAQDLTEEQVKVLLRKAADL